MDEAWTVDSLDNYPTVWLEIRLKRMRVLVNTQGFPLMGAFSMPRLPGMKA